MDYDAIVIGSGPNGLAAAILMQQNGISVLLVEGSNEVGGGMRTAELTLPGFKHDICSAIHPLAIASPFFETLPLHHYGLKYVVPEVAAAHPFDDGSAAVLLRSLSETAANLGVDESAYINIIQSLVNDWPDVAPHILGPLQFPLKNAIKMARFGIKALTPSTYLVNRFKTQAAQGLFAGMAAHGIQPLTNFGTSAVAMVLLANAHLKGWPIPKGGSASIASSLAAHFKALGGTIETGTFIRSLNQLPKAKALLFDITPKQLLSIAGHKFSSIYKWQMERYRYGMGVFKVDWALDGPIPFTAVSARQAGTVHLGNTFEEIAQAEQQVWNGLHPQEPFVLLAQQSLFDDTRAADGKHTGWAYCHVPAGSEKDMTNTIEKQVERFAPGFRDLILARHTFNSQQMEEYNPNYIRGDINGGAMDIKQLFTRPVLRRSPYTTSAKGIYICSSSTPPGGGVHGMCGYNAGKKALKDVFNIIIQ